MIDDPLAKFYDDGPSVNAGIKNPVTGIRETAETAHKKKLRDDEAQRKQDVAKRVITYLMQNDLGREWVHDFLTKCNVFGNPFTMDTKTTDLNCGALWAGKVIENEVKKFAIREYITMLEEALNREVEWNTKAADTNQPI